VSLLGVVGQAVFGRQSCDEASRTFTVAAHRHALVPVTVAADGRDPRRDVSENQAKAEPLAQARGKLDRAVCLFAVGHGAQDRSRHFILPAGFRTGLRCEELRAIG
jgi:hypothetical protein